MIGWIVSSKVKLLFLINWMKYSVWQFRWMPFGPSQIRIWWVILAHLNRKCLWMPEYMSHSALNFHVLQCDISRVFSTEIRSADSAQYTGMLSRWSRDSPQKNWEYIHYCIWEKAWCGSAHMEILIGLHCTTLSSLSKSGYTNGHIYGLPWAYHIDGLHEE